MWLGSRLFPARQALVAASIDIKALPSPDSVAMIADACKAVSWLPNPVSDGLPSRKGSHVPRSSRLLARSKGRRVQLNVDVSPELRRELRTAAKRKRITLSALVATYCAAGLDRDRQ